jgi:hypothetical protein
MLMRVNWSRQPFCKLHFGGDGGVAIASVNLPQRDAMQLDHGGIIVDLASSRPEAKGMPRGGLYQPSRAEQMHLSSVTAIALRLLSTHSGHHDSGFRCKTDIPGGFQWASDIGIFRTAIEGNQYHAIWALDLIAIF